MRQTVFSLGFFIALVIFFSGCKKTIIDKEATLPESSLKAGGNCTTIQNGTLLYASGHYLAGQPIATGYDIFGYNYQSHIFSGSYANAFLGEYGFAPYEGNDSTYLSNNPGAENTWVWPYRNDDLLMKWNDEYLSNKDCNGDGLLDHHYGFSSYMGSGAWFTNHQSGSYYIGYLCNWSYFVKIVAVPENSIYLGGAWYNSGGSLIGPEGGEEMAIIQMVIHDPCAGINGRQFVSPDHPGLGGW